MDYRQIKDIVNNHINDFKDSIDWLMARYSTSSMTEEEKFRYMLYGIIEVYEKHRGEGN